MLVPDSNTTSILMWIYIGLVYVAVGIVVVSLVSILIKAYALLILIIGGVPVD